MRNLIKSRFIRWVLLAGFAVTMNVAIAEEDDWFSAKAPAQTFSSMGYVSSHLGAFNQAVVVDWNQILLRDGSLWEAKYNFELNDWQENDQIVIIPDLGWVDEGYKYKLINLSRDSQTAQVKLVEVTEAEYAAFRVLSIDYESREVVLSDGSIWNYSMDRASFFKLANWEIGDRVIIALSPCSYVALNELLNTDKGQSFSLNCIGFAPLYK